MALNGDVLGASMAAAAKGVYDAFDPTTPVTVNQLENLYKAIGNSIVNHITSAGVTTTIVASGSSAGTYPGTIS